MFKFIKDIIAPKKCYSCSEEGHFLCDKCAYKVDRFKSFCYICKRKSDNFELHKKCKNNIFYDKIIVFAHYHDFFIKKLIKKSKFHNTKDILEDLGNYLSDSLIINEKIINKDDYIIISTPMYFLRRLKRGYNHSDILARQVSKNTNLKISTNLIKRIKNTKQQSKLSKKDRKINLKNCFKLNNKYLNEISYKNIIIIDDVISTGTTINEISRILKKAGAKKIIGLLVASD